MRGYFTAGGYYGMVDGRYLLFSDETEYFEYLESQSEVASKCLLQRRYKGSGLSFLENSPPWKVVNRTAGASIKQMTQVMCM